MNTQLHSSAVPAHRSCALFLLLARHACLWAALGLLAAPAFVGLPARGAVPETWVHRYSNVVSNSTDQAFKVVIDASGDMIVTGSTDDGISGKDMLTIKYSGADGSVRWQKRYNGPANSDDDANAVAVDGSGNVVVTGSSYNTNVNADYYTAKYAAADGALLWEKRYNGPTNSYDSALAVAVDSSGNVVVTGDSWNGAPNYGADFYTAKYAAVDGALLWEKRYNGPVNRDDIARAVAVDRNGNVFVTGFSQGRDGDGSAYYTAKYAAADGALLWEQRYANKGGAQALAVDSIGNVIVTGSSWNGANADYHTVKYAAANGALLWEKRDNGPANSDDGANAVAVDGSGNVVVTGYSWGSGSGPDYHTAKYASIDGALLWEKSDNGSAKGYDFANDVAVDASGNVVVAGSSGNGTNADYYTAKYAAADGALLWEKRYNGPGNYDDFASAVAVDASGNVVVTGFSWGDGKSYDYYTAKYSAAGGALLWETRYNGGLANDSDRAQAVAVDGSGNVVVTGSSGNGTNADYYTAKYAAADGALLWEKRGPGGGAAAVAVDGSGNVVVTGTSFADYYTTKFAAADGALLWENRYNGPANSYDEVTAVAMDGGGNVVVTGSSYNINFNADYYTVKYAAADGALLWEKRYNGPAAGDDYARAMAVDGSDNVVVTGSSYNGTNNDLYTAKYAAADGALIWEKHAHGGVRAVAVDGSGNVVVTGHSRIAPNYENDYYTAKYASADGAVLWEQRYNGPQEDYSYGSARAVAVDGGGNVVVTGKPSGLGYYTAKYAAADGALLWEKHANGGGQVVAVDGSGNVVVTGSSGDGTDADYYTAKYAAADGALLWEKRYNGPANGNDYPSSLALGPIGMVVVTGSSDGNFGSGTTFDYATIVYWENLPLVSIALVPTGVRLRFPGVPGGSYAIERAPAVTGLWSTLAKPTAPIGGLIEYVDTNPTVGTTFYRTVEP